MQYNYNYIINCVLSYHSTYERFFDIHKVHSYNDVLCVYVYRENEDIVLATFQFAERNNELYQIDVTINACSSNDNDIDVIRQYSVKKADDKLVLQSISDMIVIPM